MPHLNNIFKIAALFTLVALTVALYRAVPEIKFGGLSQSAVNASSTPGVIVARVTSNLLVINNLPIQIELADTPEKRNLGLSGRENLPPRTGMLFTFDQPGKWGFWMKDMHFPIDIIWLDGNYRPIHAAESITPQSYPKTFYPPAPATYVLEINAGEWQEALLSTK